MPKSRPPAPSQRAYADLREEIQRRTRSGASIIRKLADLADSDDTSPMERIAACRLLLEYGWGKPKQEIDVSGQIDLVGILEQVHATVIAHAVTPGDAQAALDSSIHDAEARVLDRVSSPSLPPPAPVSDIDRLAAEYDKGNA